MPLLTVRDLRIGFMGPLLLDNVSCQIDANQRIGLLGRNGAGKTTFMRIISGEVQPDGGEVAFAPGTKMSLLPQDVPAEISGKVHDVIASGVKVCDEHDPAWQIEQRIEQLIAEMQLPAAVEFATLSTGMKRRVLLARALVSQPDLLLLDEPTNHLDVASITWLEDFLLRWNATLIFVTHDRMFLRKLATRILEVDRGRLFDWSCDYDTFLKRKEDALAAEEKQNALFDKRLAEEEVWIRTGVKARRTRNEGRVRALKALRNIRSERQERTGKVQLVIQEAQRSGALVCDTEGVTFTWPQTSSSASPDGQTRTSAPTIIRDFSTTIMRGDKIGIIGPNGAGKTTLLRILLGQLKPQSGTVRLGTNLQIAYFDQLRHQLREDETVAENVGDGYDTIKFEGGSRHIIGYLQDFLFSPERSRTLVKFLSGGERNRVLLAKLFTKPANVIVLDEPTNDLDAETLELLEERLVEFAGTVLLVSHDREFLNNVVGSTIVFEDGNVKEYVGGYDDWQRQRATRLAAEAAKNAPKQVESKTATAATATTTKKKLSYKEQKELDALPGLIESLESQIAELHTVMADPKFYQQSGDLIATEQAKLKTLDESLATAYARWEALEALVSETKIKSTVMDPTKRLRERTGSNWMANGKLVGAIFSAIFVIPGLLYALVAGDAQVMNETWDWRNAVRTKGEIVQHSFVGYRNPLSPDRASTITPSYHKIRYRFSANSQEIEEEGEVPSTNPSAVTLLENDYPLKEGGAIYVHYLPDDPHKHVLFIDPSNLYWSSAKRLCWLTLITLTGVLIVVAVIVFYRPKKTDRSYLPAKIDASEFKMDG